MGFLQSDIGKALITLVSSKAVISLVGGTILGGVAKHFFDEWSAKKKAGRDLTTNVTKSIEGLARDYYWLLANNASTLRTFLQEYIEWRESIQLTQDSPADLRRKLIQKTSRVAKHSFPYYAAFLKLTFEFSWCAG